MNVNPYQRYEYVDPQTRLVERLAAVEGKRNHITRTSTDIARPPRLPRSLSQAMIQQNAFYMGFRRADSQKEVFRLGETNV